MNKPSNYLVKSEDSYCAMVDFVPKATKLSIEDAYKAELESLFNGLSLDDEDDDDIILPEEEED